MQDLLINKAHRLFMESAHWLSLRHIELLFNGLVSDASSVLIPPKD